MSIPPGGLPDPPTNRRFVLEAQSPGHATADFEAVMASREHLRAWSDSDWPADDFTLEDNRADLAGHIDEAKRGEAFGYTVLAPDRSRVLGSLYLNPAARFCGSRIVDEAAIESLREAQVEVDYWLRPELEADADFHQAFIEVAHAWLTGPWRLARPLWGSREQMADRRAFYTTLGWREVLCLRSREMPDRRMWFHGS